MRHHDRHVTRNVCLRNGSALRRAAAVTVLLPGLLLPASALAQEMTSARKAGRGFAGLTAFVLEIPGNIAQQWRTNGPAYGLTAGLAMGVGKTIVRPLVGAYELVTAPFAAPQGFEPILAPEYPWTYFQTEPGTLYGFTYLGAEARRLREIPGSVVTRQRGALVVQFPDNLLFAPGSAALSAGAEAKLEAVAAALKENPDARIEVLGYTDSTGSSALNTRLSEQRAKAVRSSLMRHGVAASRVQSQGFGDAAPIASNDTPQGRRSNRRVEIEVRASGVGAAR